MSLFSIICMAVSGITNGSFAVPMKGIRDWKWEHTWFVYTLFACGVLPVLFVVLAGGSGAFGLLFNDWETTGLVCFYGVLFGAGSVLFGISVVRLGFAAANALICSMVTLGGSMGPLILGYAQIAPGQERWLGMGLGALIVGIAVCAWSTQLRDGREAGGHRRWATGILIAVIASMLSSMLNIGFAIGAPLIVAASDRGYSKLLGSLFIWLPVLAGALIVGLAYTSFLIQRAGSWKQFSAPGSGAWWIRAIAMGVLWTGSAAIYGVGAVHVGSTGVVFGPAMVSSGSIITSNVWGVARGEWPTAGPRRVMYLATGVLVLAFCLLAIARNH
jgi:L-rhamnose-H+ transport protein